MFPLSSEDPVSLHELVGLPFLIILLAACSNFDTFAVVKLIAILMVAISYIKYVPQVQLKLAHQSTKGFCFIAVYLDISAQTLTFFELVVSELQTPTGNEAFEKTLARLA